MVAERMRYVEFEQMESIFNLSFQFEEDNRKMMSCYKEEGKYMELSGSLEDIITKCSSNLELQPKRKIPSVYFVLGKPGSGNIEIRILIFRENYTVQ